MADCRLALVGSQRLERKNLLQFLSASKRRKMTIKGKSSNFNENFQIGLFATCKIYLIKSDYHRRVGFSR